MYCSLILCEDIKLMIKDVRNSIQEEQNIFLVYGLNNITDDIITRIIWHLNFTSKQLGLKLSDIMIDSLDRIHKEHNWRVLMKKEICFEIYEILAEAEILGVDRSIQKENHILYYCDTLEERITEMDKIFTDFLIGEEIDKQEVITTLGDIMWYFTILVIKRDVKISDIVTKDILKKFRYEKEIKEKL